MEPQILPVAAAQPAPPPVIHADLRPTADSAALLRNPQPHIPMPMPASIAQKGAVAQARMSAVVNPVASVERVLKPYGVVMLPHGPAPDTPQRSGHAHDADADPMGNTGETARTAQDAGQAASAHIMATDDTDRPSAA